MQFFVPISVLISAPLSSISYFSPQHVRQYPFELILIVGDVWHILQFVSDMNNSRACCSMGLGEVSVLLVSF